MFYNGAGMPKSPLGTPKRLREAQNRRPQIGSFQCGTAGVEMPGRAGSGRVATETGIDKRAPSKRAQEKNTPFGHTPHSDVYFLIYVYVCTYELLHMNICKI